MGFKQVAVGGALVLALALGLRLWNLTLWPVFADESIYIRWAQVMRAEPTLRFLPLSDGKQPLFMWLVIPFLKIASDPLLAGRLVSVLAGVSTVVGVGVASYLLFKNQRQTFIAMLLAAVLPYLVFFDRLALADSLLTMWLVWTFNFSLLSLVHHRWDWAMLAGFTLGFAWLTKSPAVLAFGLIPLGLLLTKWHIKLVGLILTTYVIAFGMYNILRLGPEFHMIALRNADYVFSWREVLQHPRDPLIPHLRDVKDFYSYLVSPLVVLSAIVGLAWSGKAHWRNKVVVIGWWLVPIVVVSAVAKQFTARYVLFTVPFAVILAGYGLEVIGQHTRRHILAWIGVGLIVVWCLAQDAVLLTRPEDFPLPRNERSGYLEEWTAGQGITEVAQQIRSFAKISPVVVGSEGFFGTPFNALQMYLNDVPNVRVVGVGVWVDGVHEKLRNAVAENQVFLVVNASRLHVADPASAGLKLLAGYPKAMRPSGTQDYLLFFQVK